MKLLQRPKSIIDYIDCVNLKGGAYMAGMDTIENIKILIPDKEDPKAEVWHKLKYGSLADFEIGRKIDQMIFHEDGEEIIMYGILPIAFERSLIWEGKIVECRIDQYVINETGAK